MGDPRHPPPHLQPTVVTGPGPASSGSTSDGSPGVPIATAVAIPPSIGGYALLGELGRGGMGVVYRAEDPSLKREVALKVMLPQFAAHPTAKARFVREARAQAKVEHEHVVAIHQVAEFQGLPYIVMPLLKGMTLQAALRANARPPISEVIRIGREAAEGLAAAHENGLVHRDIKPANIWLEGRRLRVRILDFGLARIAEDTDATEGDDPVTREGSLVGTPAYMSPEQARGMPVDGRTDLWSLGVVLYQMAAGTMPFHGDSAIGVLTSVSIDHPLPPAARNPAVPPHLSDLIMRLLAKLPAYRPPSADAVADELRAIESELAGAVRTAPLESGANYAAVPMGGDPFAGIDATEPDLTHRPEHHEPQRRTDSRAWLYAAGGAVLLALLAVAAVLLGGRAKKPAVETIEPDPVRVAPTPRPKPKEVPADYKEVHGVDLDGLKDWASRLSVGGFRPVAVSARGGTPDLLFDAVAHPDPRDWVFLTTPLGSEQAVFDDYRGRGYVPRVRVVHPVANAPHVSEVWVREPGLVGWTAWNGRRTFIEGKFREALAAERAPVHVSTGGGEIGLIGTAVFVRAAGAPWEVDLDVQLNDLVRKVGECRAKGWRPKSLVAVPDPNRVRFAVVYGENAPFLEWDFQSGLSPAEYEAAIADRRAKRQRPGLVASSMLDGDPRYAVVWEEVPDPDAERRVALALRPHASSLTVRAGGVVTTVRRDDPGLPDGPLELLGVSFHDVRLPPDFTSRVLIPAVAELRALASIVNLTAPATPAELAKLAGTAAGATLNELVLLDSDLTPATIDALRRFRHLTTLGISAKGTDDDTLARLKELPRLTSLSLRGLDTRGKVTDKGFEAVATLPLRSLGLAWSDLAPQHYRGLAAMPNLVTLDLSQSSADDAALADLAACPKLVSLNLIGTKVTPRGLESVSRIATLRSIELRRTGITAKGLLRLVASRPDVRIYWDGGVIEPSKRP
jgi:hypothetical protein